jgi:hypothetical protein
MVDATQRMYRRVTIVVRSLFIAGIIAILLGVASSVVGRFGVLAGLSLCGGVGAIALAQVVELLMEIASQLAAIRAQMEKGILGLLG